MSDEQKECDIINCCAPAPNGWAYCDIHYKILYGKDCAPIMVLNRLEAKLAALQAGSGVTDEELARMHEQLERVRGDHLDRINTDVLHRYMDEQAENIARLQAGSVRGGLEQQPDGSVHFEEARQAGSGVVVTDEMKLLRKIYTSEESALSLELTVEIESIMGRAALTQGGG